MTRPVNLDLTTMHFPPMAIISILHRLSGILLFVLLPVILCMIHCGLRTEMAFEAMRYSLCAKLIFWMFASAAIFHILAGLRHIIMDLGFGEGLAAGRMSALLTMTLAAALIILCGIWIW